MEKFRALFKSSDDLTEQLEVKLVTDPTFWAKYTIEAIEWLQEEIQDYHGVNTLEKVDLISKILSQYGHLVDMELSGTILDRILDILRDSGISVNHQVFQAKTFC